MLNELNAIYLEIATAIHGKDLNVIAKYISHDWTGVHGEAIVTREILLENLRSQFERFDEISWPRSLSDFRMDGKQVTVRAAGLYGATQRDSHELICLDLANDDTWLEGPSGWQNIYSKGL